MTAIQTWANGNIQGTDLSSSAGISASQIAAGWGKLAVRVTAVSVTAGSGDLVVPTTSVTVTLPTAPAVNTVVGVVVGYGATGASAVTVNRAGSATIYGVGLSGATTLALGTGGAQVVLQFDGTNWAIVSGQQDTGWVPMSLSTNITTGTGTGVAATRLLGDRVFLRGHLTNNTGGSVSASTIATITTAHRLSVNTQTPIAVSNPAVLSLQILTDGTISPTSNWFNTALMWLDGVSYSLS